MWVVSGSRKLNFPILALVALGCSANDQARSLVGQWQGEKVVSGGKRILTFRDDGRFEQSLLIKKSGAENVKLVEFGKWRVDGDDLSIDLEMTSIRRLDGSIVAERESKSGTDKAKIAWNADDRLTITWAGSNEALAFYRVE
jgi:hypothetical protein